MSEAMTKEALTLALEAIYALAAMNHTTQQMKSNAIAAIKEALSSPNGEAQPAVAEQHKQEPWLLETTQTLAKHMAREFYPEVTQWECLDNLAGVISQIDNMTTGLMRKPEQEPVKYEFQVPDGTWHPFLDKTHYENTVEDGSWPIRALYTTPLSQSKPLTDEQICEIEKDHLVNFRIPLGGQYDFVRAIEAAHGIKENT